MKKRLLVVTACLMCFVMSAGFARAGLLFTLTPTYVETLPGMSLVFCGTLTNEGDDELFLNGNSFTLSGGSWLTLDDTKFWANVPVSLGSNECWSGELFEVVVSADAVPGYYLGSFDILGGLDGSSQDLLASQNFQVRVVPEPCAFILGLLGLAGGIAGRRVIIR